MLALLAYIVFQVVDLQSPPCLAISGGMEHSVIQFTGEASFQGECLINLQQQIPCSISRNYCKLRKLFLLPGQKHAFHQDVFPTNGQSMDCTSRSPYVCNNHIQQEASNRVFRAFREIENQPRIFSSAHDVISLPHRLGSFAGVLDRFAGQFDLPSQKESADSRDSQSSYSGPRHQYGSIRHRLLGDNIPRIICAWLLGLGLWLTFYGFIWADRQLKP